MTEMRLAARAALALTVGQSDNATLSESQSQ